MSISFESAVETLKVMFPDWDEETLSTILVSNNYHVENTIETVLSMGETNGEEKPVSRASSPPVSRSGAVGAPAPAPRPNQGSSQSANASRGPSPSQSGYGAPAPASSSSSRNRGLRCELPADFLRPPNWEPNSHTILADEELALMLQDELFRAQARDLLGDNFPGGGSRRTVPSNGSTSNRNQPAAGNTQPQPDMGILKALNSMGSAAKRNLSNLAQGFSSNNNNNTSNSSRGGPPPAGGAVRRGSGGGSRRKKGQFDDLDDDEEGTEIITFSGTESGSRHVLQNSGARTADQDGDDEDGVNDSENPLLANRGTNNVTLNKK